MPKLRLNSINGRTRFGLAAFLVLSLFVIAPFWSCSSDGNSSTSELSDSSSVQTISSAIRENPRDASLFFLRGKAYLIAGKPDSAISDFLIATRLDSLKADYYLALSDVYLASAESENALNTLLRCVKNIPDQTEAMVRLASMYLYVKDYSKSLKYLDDIYQINKDFPGQYFVRGLVVLDQGDTVNAATLFQKTTELDPDRADAYNMLGILYAAKRDSLAVQYYSAAIRLWPDSVQPRYNLALFFQENERYADAFREYRYILDKMNSKHLHSYFNQGYIHMLYLLEYDKAIAYFDTVLSLNPSYIDAMFNKGFCYEKKKDYAQAKEIYNQCLQRVTNYELAIKGLNRLDKK
jgi:tetratricopeptide (TPR) repeat protein